MRVRNNLSQERIAEILKNAHAMGVLSKCAQCISCCRPLAFIYKTGVRDFCHECEEAMARERLEEAQRIVKRYGRR